MPMFVPEVAKWFRTHQGVANRATLTSLGLSPATTKSLVGSGELIVEHEGVYRSPAWPVDVKSRCAAFCAADDRVVVCCGGAAQLWEYRSCTKVGVHITTTAPGRPIGGSTVVHRCSIMPTGHVHHRLDGIRVTSPVRTVFDLAKHVEPITLERVIEQGLRRRQFDIRPCTTWADCCADAGATGPASSPRY